MPLAWKIVLSAGVPIVLLVGATGAGIRSLADTDAVTRRTLRRIVLIVRETDAADEIASAAMRLHGRWSALQDPSYEKLWTARMTDLEQRLRSMARRLDGDGERRRLDKASDAFARYRARTSADDGGVLRLRALGPDDLRAAQRESARARRTLRSITRGLETAAHTIDARVRAVERDTAALLRASATLAALLALLASGWAALRVARALRRLAWASEALERGRLDEPVGIGGNDELARLGTAFETLGNELRERERFCDELLRRLGHGLDAPLRSIRETTGTLVEEVRAGTADQRRLAAAIGDETERLLGRAARIGDARVGVAYTTPLPIAFDPPALLEDHARWEESS